MIKSFFAALAGAINRRPVAVAVLVFLVIAAGVYGTAQLTMESGWKTYINEDSPQGIVYSQYSENFQSDSIILIIEASDPLSPDVLDYIDTLETDIAQQQNIGGTYSVVDLLKSANGGELPSSGAETNLIIASLPEAVRDQVTPSNVLTLVQIKLGEGISKDAQTSALNIVSSAVASSDPPPGVTVEISGTPAFLQQMEQGLSSNMAMLIGGAMILIIIVMGILFSYVRYRFMPVVMVGIGLVISLGMMGIFGISLNMAVIGAFPVLIGLGIDYAIQFHARFDEEARKGSLEDAVFVTVTKTGPAVMYAMLATCMGFLAMFVSEVPMIRSFGLVAIVGIFTCYWASCIGVPTFGLLLKYRPKQPKTELCYAVGTDACDSVIAPPDKTKNQKKAKKKSYSYGQFLTGVSVKIAKKPMFILIIAGLIAFVGFQMDPYIPVQTSENSFVPADMPAKINIDKVKRIIGSTSTADFYIRGQSVTDLDTLQWLQEFQEYELAHHPEITGATSIVTYILAYNGGTMPETQDTLDSVLEKIPEETRDQYTSGSMSAIVKFNTADLGMDQKNTLKEQMLSDIAFLDPPSGITASPTGDFEVFTRLIASLSESKETMTLLGFLLVFLFLILVYRHIHAITPIIPIIFGVGWNAVAMTILNIPYTPLTATLGSMTIGVAAEYTILVMERYAEEQERLHDHIAAIQESVKKIGTAITVSGMATFFGFSALLLSTFPIISNFGISTLIAVGFSLIGAIFIMPATLSIIGRFEKTDRHIETGSQSLEDDPV